MLDPLTFLLVLTAPSLAVPLQFDVVETAWERALSSPTFQGLHPVEVEAAPDGGVLVVGLARQGPLDNFLLPADVVLMRLDENGDLQWTDTLPSPPVPNGSFTGGRYVDAAFDEHGDVYLIVSRPAASVLRRYDESGAIVWGQSLTGGTLYNANAVEVAPSGDIVVGGLVMQGAYPFADVRSFRPDGTLLWEWGAGSGGMGLGYPRGLAISPDGTVYPYGQSDMPGTLNSPQIFALDSGGELLWSQTMPLSSASVIDVAFDSQDRIVAIASSLSISSSFFVIGKYGVDGTPEFYTSLSEPGFVVGGKAVAVDAFDRIAVGGWRRPATLGSRDATLFRIDPAGALVGRSVPSVAGAAQDGSLEDLAVTSRNDVVALGFSRTGFDEIITARFAPDGTERWSERRRGLPPEASGSPAVGLSLALDTRGNLFTLSQTVESGVYPNQTLGVDLAKHVQNGPAGTSYCGPAVPNSTGSSATMRALGPSLRSADNVTLRADDLPPGALTLLLASRMQGSVPAVGGGQGRLCLGGAIGRFFGPGQVRVADADGSAALQLALGQLPQPNGSIAATAGESWSFQAWYRDANPDPTSNLTDGVEVLFQ